MRKNLLVAHDLVVSKIRAVIELRFQYYFILDDFAFQQCYSSPNSLDIVCLRSEN